MQADVPQMVAALRRELPGSERAAAPELLDVGFSSTVLRMGSTVARVARNGDAAAGHRRQLALIPLVAGHLSIGLPSELRLVPPTEGLPFGALLSEYIHGRPMVPADVTRNPRAVAKMATVLTELHVVPLAELPPESIGSFDPIAELRRLQAETGAELDRRLAAADRRVLDARLSNAFELLPTGATAFCHGDPWFGNFLVNDEGEPVALLDFEDACTGDPAMDLAAVFHLPRATAQDVVARYLARRPADPSINERIELHRVVRELAGLSYVIRNEQLDEIANTAARLRAILGGSR